MCEQVNAGLPENQKPKCEKCEKIPKVNIEAKHIVDIYQVLLTLSIEPNTGLVRYDLPLIRSLFDLFGVDNEGRKLASALLLHMILESAKIRLKKRKVEKDKEDAKRNRDKFKSELRKRR